TVVIVLVNTGLYIATALFSQRSGGGALDLDPRTLFMFGAKEGSAIVGYGQWWRLITAGYLHGGLLHILMNMYVLFDLGAQVEETYGGARYLVMYSVANVTGFMASLYHSPVLSIGASAAIFGLIGGMIALGVRERSAYGAAVRRVYMRWAIFALVLSFLPGTD